MIAPKNLPPGSSIANQSSFLINPLAAAVANQCRPIALGMGLALAVSLPLQAATFNVTNTLDGPNPGPANSLRWAVNQANMTPGLDDIDFDLPNGSTIVVGGSDGDIDIFESVHINGPGAENLTISGNNTNRIFHIYYDGNGTPLDDVVISGLTLLDGNASLPFGLLKKGDCFENGGAICVEDGNFTLQDSVVTDNVADYGGGIAANHFYYGIPGADARLNGMVGVNMNIEGSTIENNSAHVGGGVYADNVGNVTITYSTIRNNHAFHDDYYYYSSGDGGGVFARNTHNVTIQSSDIVDNEAYDEGGGVALRDIHGEVIIDKSEISGNIAGYDGGGLHVAERLRKMIPCDGQVCEVPVTAERVENGFYYYNMSLDITNTTIAENNAGFSGGGIFLGSSQLRLSGKEERIIRPIFDFGIDYPVFIENTTISTNSAGFIGGGMFVDDIDEGSVEISLTTIANNHAGDVGGGLFFNDHDYYYYYYGDPVRGIDGNASESDTIYVSNTIIGDNTADNDFDEVIIVNGPARHIEDPGFANDVFTAGDNTLSVEYSLIEDPSGATIIETIPGSNRFNRDPLLGPLQDNGGDDRMGLGPTRTHLPYAYGPVVDRGNEAFADDPNDDQRGEDFNRVVGHRVDMGAVEVQVEPIPTLSLAGLFALAGLLVGAARIRLRRRRSL